jgi:hypothetical protein
VKTVRVSDMPKKLTITDAQEHAKLKNGICISETYLNNHEDLIWKCSHGHLFEKSFKSVRKNEWCPFCSGKYVLLKTNELSKIAELKGGRYLSGKDLLVSEVAEWECGDGHRWSAIVNNVVNLESWCKVCKNNRGEQVTRFIFESLTGELFPTKRPDWLRLPGNKRSLELDGFNEKLRVAFEHQGRQHYQSSKLTSRFFKNSILQNDIDKREICKKMGVKVLEVPQVGGLINLEEAINLIKNFLKENKVEIVFDLTVDDITSNAHGLNKNHIEDLRKIAETKGGNCLSSIYLGHVYPLKFRCANGHQWEARPNDIKRGSWCSICSKAGGKKKTIEELSSMFIDIDIRCLSEKYSNSKEKYLWECGKGHRFNSRYDNLKLIRQCPVCSN